MNSDFEVVGKKFDNVRSMHFCGKFAFRGFGSAQSHCALVLLETKDGKRIVVCSQPKGKYLGTSVTNAVEIINAQLRTTKFKAWTKWEPGTNYWLEHYPVGTGLLTGRYTLMLVTYEGGGFNWGRNSSWGQAAAHFGLPVEALAYGFEDEARGEQ